MVLHVAGLVVVLAIAGLTAIGMAIYWWWAGPGRRHAVALAFLSALWLAATQLQYWGNPPCPGLNVNGPGTGCRADGQPVQWERGPLTAINLVFVMTAYGLFADFGWASYVVLNLLALLVGVCWTLSLLGNTVQQVFVWFGLAAFFGIFTALLKYYASRDLKLRYYFGVLFLGSVAGAAIGFSYLLSPLVSGTGGILNGGVISESWDFVIYEIGATILFALVPILLVIMYEPPGGTSLANSAKAAAGRMAKAECERLTS